MREIEFTVRLGFGPNGRIDREAIEANLHALADRAWDEGLWTPDEDDHAMLVSVDSAPAGVPVVVKPEDKLASAKSQGQAQFDSILEMVEELRASEEDDEGRRDYRRGEEARERIQEDALSVQVRSGWYSPGQAHDKVGQPEEYEILLCTGGPAVRIVGELSEHCEPETARMEVQDWFQPWTEFRPINTGAWIEGFDSQAILLDYARCFWFGE